MKKKENFDLSAAISKMPEEMMEAINRLQSDFIASCVELADQYGKNRDDTVKAAAGITLVTASIGTFKNFDPSTVEGHGRPGATP